MSLTLTVLSFKNRPINEISPVFIDSEGGSIGRSDDNTLMLPDTEKFVSRHHASIKMENGYYYLSDTSLSGVLINGSEPALHNATARIENGTLLRIGEYEIAVSIANESALDDFPFTRDRTIPEPKAFLSVDEPWVDMDDMGFNSLMADNFPSHEELVQSVSDRQPANFKSHLQDNKSPLFDSYIAPEIIPAPTPAPVAFSAPAVEQIPEDFSFDDLFAAPETVEYSPQPVNKASVHRDFEDFFDAAVSKAGTNQPIIRETPTANPENADSLAALFADNDAPETVTVSERKPAETTVLPEYNNIAPVTQRETNKTSPADSVLFNAFLQGAAVECGEIHPEQQAETLLRIGQMFRKLIDGTIAILRSRAEFKSLCRVNMTVIRATNNNPLKFTVSTDDVLRQLLENKTDGFLASTIAIEEAFDDVMNHQLAMQAGIQASLTHLLHGFDPKVIEKQFEYGMVLQKKAKCWEKYEETYHNTVDDAVENFFGEEFVKAYEKQMALLKNPHGK
jgi:type VI secretion system FHA domain protein